MSDKLKWSYRFGGTVEAYTWDEAAKYVVAIANQTVQVPDDFSLWLAPSIEDEEGEQ